MSILPGLVSSRPLSSSPPVTEGISRVLLVHTEPGRRHALQELLVDDGYDCLGVSDADEVLRLVAEYEPDLILLATDLPGACGLEVCGELRAGDLQGQTPIILLSEDSIDEEEVARGLLAGADDFVWAPDRPIELSARIRVQLRNKRYRDALRRLRNERDHLRRETAIDPLTGLLNRRSLEQVILKHFEARERFAVLFADVDHFKSVNDRFGHDVGDRVLKAVAERLKAAVRPGDASARYGGEEFVLVVAGAGPESARIVAERHRKAIESMDASELGGPEHLTISIGVAIHDPRNSLQTPDRLVRNADAALYTAKRSGRNRVEMAEPDDEPRLVGEIAAEALRRPSNDSSVSAVIRTLPSGGGA